MFNESVGMSDFGDRPPKARSSRVQICVLGSGDSVNETIAELTIRQFGEANLWSEPFLLSELSNPFALSPGEVMRICSSMS